MIKSINVWAFDAEQPLTQTFAQARAAGFDGIEVAIAESGPITPASTREECEAIAAAARDANLQVVGLASGMGWSCPIAASDAKTRALAVENTAKSLHIAKWLGTDAILLVPGTVGDNRAAHHVSYDEAMENTRASLHELLPTARETGVSIGLENVWNKFLLSPLETRDFIDSFGDDKIGCVFRRGKRYSHRLRRTMDRYSGAPYQAHSPQRFQARNRNTGRFLRFARWRREFSRSDEVAARHRLRRRVDGGIFRHLRRRHS